MTLNTDHLKRCIKTLRQSIALLMQQKPDTLEYEIFRNATIKGYELTLETAGTKHGLLTIEETKRWFIYRDNRNNTAHDYGVGFAEETLKLLPKFVEDAQRLKESLDHA